MPRLGIKPQNPTRPLFAGRSIGRDLVALVNRLPSRKVAGDQFFQIAEFPEVPRQAYWFAGNLRRRRKLRGFEFSATIEKGVGRLFCRRKLGAK